LREFLFVYGTLMSGFKNRFRDYLVKNSIYLGKAKIRGELYLISWYPGLNCKNRGWVYGELYQLKRAKELLTKLDIYEDCSSTSPKPHLYKRVKRETILEDNSKRVLAWVYCYQGYFNPKYKIKSGIFSKEILK